MPMKIAVIGSRVYPDAKKSDIARFISGLPDGTVLVSGGARGVDQIAEACHKGRVFSFRIYKDADPELPICLGDGTTGPVDDHYGVEFWDYGGPNPRTIRFDCFFADARSALVYRDWLIAHECDELYAFWNGYSKGTETTMSFAQALGKKVTPK